MKSREFRDRLLIALYQSASANDLGGFIKPSTAADEANLPRKTGQLRLTLQALDSEGLIRLSQTLGGGDEGGMDVRLTAYGIEAAEELAEQYEGRSSPDEAPDSGDIEYVRTDSIGLEPGEVAQLQSLVSASNAGEEIERAVALAEIAVFEAAIGQPLVATDLIDRFVNFVLKWIGQKFPDAVIQTVIAALIVKLAPFLAT